MKYLIVGLGNPGVEYEHTRHNVGFMVLDALVDVSSTSFSADRLGEVATMRYRGRQVVLLKPSTFMNRSGRAVQYWLNKEKIPLANLLVIVDDLALSVGDIRLRAKGSAGGHNGLHDIENVLQTRDYARLRIGIGQEFSRGRQIDYVLSPFKVEESDLLEGAIGKAQEAVKMMISIGIERTMNHVNTKPKPGNDAPKE